ncbi:2-amino-4-hydroxy-6-hydroxymethyldihydropteridine diphosphokinase [Pelagicoccus mobilis]|uniref:2-amino-4-hydroxy-6-hydroxymethyldihydropteridine pyrophosphokinase n=1 Tax=Pelagicoccus mobilis TaxID=415221 RepID=A0A934S3R4_9BACT|nr:2-amino-4-hydroxy-6-hydroxymethyldihydropteridine diphosphokinase [Pelagicoccus mobilis]MBK1879237.1 2-amino-4-hydroxy-6-hydroxymethyldihydropteridine diphosphokinase [Pelagicoccus mobilis]
MIEAFIGLGSNIGCKSGNIRRAANRLLQFDGIQSLELSPFYRTDPVGNVDQDWFVNAVARVQTSLSARELLELCLEVEREQGRVRKERWGPRIIDLDVLFYGTEIVREDDLEIPHPRVRERAFVVVPLLDLAPEFSIEGEPLRSCLPGLEEQGIVRMDPVVAILGASEKPDRYANMAQKLLVEYGHVVRPIAPRGNEILGEPVLAKMTDCNEPVDTLTLYVGSARLPAMLEELLELCPRRVIFNPGTENAEVRRSLEEAGIETIEACTLVMLKVGTFTQR